LLQDVFSNLSNGDLLTEEKSNIGNLFEKFNSLNKSLSNIAINYVIIYVNIWLLLKKLKVL
jgi:hypothetical protein